MGDVIVASIYLVWKFWQLKFWCLNIFLFFFLLRLSTIFGEEGWDSAVHSEITRLNFLSFLVSIFFFLCSLYILQLKVIWLCCLALYCICHQASFRLSWLLCWAFFLSVHWAFHIFMFVGTTNAKTGWFISIRTNIWRGPLRIFSFALNEIAEVMPTGNLQWARHMPMVSCSIVS